ncbi:hypothetical protein QW131_13960 [Roseibium salinum]|nr:hypothetical protein [Roseibium salinum]
MKKITSLRQEADDALARQTESVNRLLSSIEDTDAAIRDATQAGVTTAEMEDERDRLVEQLSGYLDVEVSRGADGTLAIQTADGQQLYADGKPSTLSFTSTHSLQPGQPGNTITVRTPGGSTYDLIAASRSGSMVAMAELRDDILTEAQTQLDTIAAEVSLAFSNVTVDSTAATVGPDSGYDLDVSALQPGNTVTLEYTDSSGQAQTVTLVAVDDASLLPLDNSATANPGDTVYGIDISSGTPATYITNITAALAGTGLQVSNDGSDNLRILGDTGGPTSVQSLSAEVTVTANSDQGLGLAIFVDQRAGTDLFTDALEKRRPARRLCERDQHQSGPAGRQRTAGQLPDHADGKLHQRSGEGPASRQCAEFAQNPLRSGLGHRLHVHTVPGYRSRFRQSYGGVPGQPGRRRGDLLEVQGSAHHEPGDPLRRKLCGRSRCRACLHGSAGKTPMRPTPASCRPSKSSSTSS